MLLVGVVVYLAGGIVLLSITLDGRVPVLEGDGL